MGRVPFYAYPNPPYSFYASPAEAYFHRQHPPFSTASSSAPRPSPTSRSVINVPVYDSAPSRPSSSPAPQGPPAPRSLIDPSFAATKIQSHFCGFCVRRHHPLLHLRTIARACKQLEDLQSELEIPEFSLKVRASEKERLRFSENVMAIILRLDAIEGSIAEVRSQRKEATKMAIKLQDALDAIMMQRDEIAALDPTDDKDGITPSNDGVLIEQLEQPQEAFDPEVDGVQGEACANANVNVNRLQQEHVFSDDNGASTCMPNFDNNNAMDVGAAEDVSSLYPCEAEVLAEQGEAESGGTESVSQVRRADAMSEAGQDMALLTGEASDGNASHAETVSQVRHAEAMCEAEQDMALLTGEASDGNASHAETVATHPAEEVGNGKKASSGNASHAESVDTRPAEEEVGNGNKASGGSASHAESVATHPAEEEIEHGHDALHVENHENYMQNHMLDMNVDMGTCVDNMAGAGDGSEKREPNDGTHRCMDVPSAPQDNATLHQLSEDCRQLKSLVGKLLAQNKAQSNIMCVLAERLELLEHRQQQNCQRNPPKTREKRRLKKGSKRSVKHHKYEEC